MKLVVKVSKQSDGKYRAWCPALPGCHALGASAERAADNIDAAVGRYLASLDISLPEQYERQIMQISA